MSKRNNSWPADRNTQNASVSSASKPFVALSVSVSVVIVVILIIICLNYRHYTNADNVLASGVFADQGQMYTTYSSLNKEGQLDEEGNYLCGSNDGQSAHPGLIHVTFGKNSHIDVHYYYDEEKTQEIKTSNCYLKPGCSVYVGGISYQNVTSSVYQLAGFDIRGIDGKVLSYQSNSTIQLPESDSCREISIVPKGEYPARRLNLSAFYYEPDGTPKELKGGDWSVNDTPYDSDVGIDPLADYAVTYCYNRYAEGYYYAGAFPAPQNADESHNMIIFSKVNAEDGVSDFTVELHPYISLTISNDKYSHNREIIKRIDIKRAGSTKTVEFKDGKKVEAGDFVTLKHGDVVLITIDDAYQIVSDSLSDINSSRGNSDKALEYRFEIPENNYLGLELSIKPKNSSNPDPFILPEIPHATVSLKYADGHNVKDSRPGEKEKVVLSITAEDGYYLEGKGIGKDGTYSSTMTFKEYEQKINELLGSISVKKYISIALETTDPYGSCTYKLDGKSVSGQTKAKEGQTLVVSYEIDASSNVSIITDKGKTKKSGKIEVKIASDMDGKTIQPSDYFAVK